MTLLTERVLVPISISLKLGLYVVPFLRYSALKIGVTLKLGVGVLQGHRKWRRSIDHTTFYRSAIVSIAVYCIIFKLFDVESWPWKGHWRSFKLVPLASLVAVSYSPSIVTMALSCISSEIKRDIGRKSWFFHTPLHSTPLLGGPRQNIPFRFV